MEPDFWHKRWENNELGFHEPKGNQFLMKYFNRLSMAKGERVFLPLCGKTNDIGWLLSQGYQVVGAELSELAINQLFEALKIKPNISQIGSLSHYSAKHIDMFVGDIFELSAQTLGKVNAIYDRAALVALPEKMRHQYTAHLMEMTNQAPQLLVTFVYDQSVTHGPPFSVNKAEVNKHYQKNYELIFLDSTDVTGGLRGEYPAKENVWLLQKFS